MLYTKPEAAKELQVSVDTVERMVRRGELAVTKLGTCVRFTRENIDRCIQRNTVCRSCGREPRDVIGAELAAMGKL